MIVLNEFIRKLDGLGRIVIPKEYRKKLKISDDSKLKISINDNFIKVEKYSDIDDNITELEKYQKILNKYLDLNIIITDLEENLTNRKELSEKIINKIKYGKIEVFNREKDILFHNDDFINFIIVPIFFFGEVIGSLIGYSTKREITEQDKRILEMVQLILIKNLEE